MTTYTSVEIAVGKVRQAAFELSTTDSTQAARMLVEALKLQPGHADLLGDLAVVHLQGGRHAQCIQAAREALVADPQHDESAYALALALEASGQLVEARRVYAELALGDRAGRFGRMQPGLHAQCCAKVEQLRDATADQPTAAAPAPTRATHAAATPTAGTAANAAAPWAPLLTRAHALGQLLNETTGIRELTLDCFDTILWRHTDRPTDVFHEMATRPAFRAAAIDGLMRANAERQARELHWVRTGRTEVSLDQIYLAARPGLSGEMLRWLAEDELAAEMHACHAHPGAVQLLREAKARGLPITIVSDTYFSSEQLQRLLRHALPADAFAAIGAFVCSSDHGVCKSKGLFKLARLNRAGDASSVLHVGDNKEADVDAPKALGMSATHLLHETDGGKMRRRMAATALSLLDPTARGSRPLHMPYRPVHATFEHDTDAPHTAIGHAALGPVMHAFARWIDDEAQTLAATRARVKLVFLMRDAHLPLETYRAIGGSTPAFAAHVSRFSAYAASFRRVEHVDQYLAHFGRNVTLDMIARQLLLPKPLAEELVREAKAAPHPLQHFVAAVRKPGVLAEIVAASAAFRERLHRYLANVAGLERGDTMVLVDLGYAGTIQRVLGPVLAEERDIEVCGRYLLAVGAVDERRKALIDRSWLDDRALASLQPYVGLLETLCTSDSESVVGYDDNGHAVFEHRQVDAGQAALVAPIQDECLRFARQAEGYFRDARRAPSAEALRDEALASFARMLFFPSHQELRHLSRFELDVNLGSGVTRRLFDLDAGLDGLRRHGLFYVGHAQATSDLRMTIPAELRAAGLELSLSLLAQHRFGLEIHRSEWSMRSAPLHVILTRDATNVQATIDAAITHDGYFSALVPVSGTEADIALAFGRDHEWIQLHSVHLVAMSTTGAGTGAEVDVTPMLVRGGTVDHGHGLLHFADDDALLMLPAGALPSHGRAALRVVFRPIGGRGTPA